jgi:hypothetical protein
MLLRFRLPLLLLLLLLLQTLSSRFCQPRTRDVRCCCSSGYALQHDGAFSAAALQCCYCYCFERWAFWPFGAAAAPSVALLVKRLCCRLHATAPVYLIRLLLRAASPEKQFNRDN